MAVRQEALDIHRSFILEAPAGSGKTALLTARFLSLLADVKHPRQILAVTFTRKAAAEMAGRITATLCQARNGMTPVARNPWEVLLLDLARNALEKHPEWDTLLRSPDAFMVDTFHGFCGRIARNWPLEARVPPAFPLLDEIGQEALLAAAVARYIHAFAAGDPRLTQDETASFLRRLAAANNSVRAISAQLIDLLARRDRLDSLIPIFQHAVPEEELTRRTEQLAALYLGRLRDHFSRHAKDWQDLHRHLTQQHAGLAGSLPPDIPGTVLRALPEWQAAAGVFLVKTGTPRQQLKPGDFGQGFSANPLAQFIKQLPPEIAWILNFTREWLAGGDPVGFGALRDTVILARGALDQFHTLMNARGVDFMELELAALRAFRQVDRPGESLIFYHEHLRHILVDEAQDMNDTQVRILSALTEGWESDDGRTVFIVGDPKQSIFRFRRAEVSLFESLKSEGLPREGEFPLPLRALSLSANFRSRASLVKFANAAFERIMRAPNPAFDEVAFKASDPVRNDAPTKELLQKPVILGLFHCRHANNKQSDLPRKPEARYQEARYVADRIVSLHQKDSKATIAVLIPARTHLTPYVTAMEALAIPVRLMEGIPMLDCPEIRHLLNLFKALIRPHDDVAWAGALRAPWVCAPLSILEQIGRLPEPAVWSGKIIAEGRNLHPSVTRFINAYEKIRPDFGREPYAVSLQRLWEELDGPAAVARISGASGIANIMQCLDILGQCPDGCGEETLDVLERLLERAYTPPDPRSAFSPISIMTIHKAKGLEFDHVFAVGLDYPAGSKAALRELESAFLMDRLPERDRIFLAATATDRRTDARPLAHLLLGDLGLRRNVAEYRRLVYVAATRARETLTLSGLVLYTADGKERPDSASGSAISWLDTMARDGIFGNLPVQALDNPEPSAARAPFSSPPSELSEPAPFAPEPLPYLIRSPSRIEDETATAARPGTDEPDPDSRARGVVMHRIFETLARRRPLPSERSVTAALAGEGIAPNRQHAMAHEVMAECRQAWDFEPFAKMRNSATEVIPEWAIEDTPGKTSIRVGRIDLLLKTSEQVILVDFKTGKPGKDEKSWLAAETERYRPQLDAYREMAARVLGKTPDRIHPVLFFTTLPRWVEVH